MLRFCYHLFYHLCGRLNRDIQQSQGITIVLWAYIISYPLSQFYHNLQSLELIDGGDIFCNRLYLFNQLFKIYSSQKALLSLLYLYLCLVLLANQKVIGIEMGNLLLPLASLVVFVAVAVNKYFICQYLQQKPQKKKPKPNNNQILQFFVLFNIFFFSIFLLISFCYFQNSLMIALLFVGTATNIAVTFIFGVFIEEISLFIALSQHGETPISLTFFEQIFLQNYKAINCRNLVDQVKNSCLLCQGEAQYMFDECGHLNTCRECLLKMPKRRNYCLVCKRYCFSLKRVYKFTDLLGKGYRNVFFSMMIKWRKTDAWLVTKPISRG